MTDTAGWDADISPAAVLAVMVFLIVGIPALAVIGSATAIGLIEWW